MWKLEPIGSEVEKDPSVWKDGDRAPDGEGGQNWVLFKARRDAQ